MRGCACGSRSTCPLPTANPEPIPNHPGPEPEPDPNPNQVDLSPLDGFPLWEQEVHDQLHACYAELSQV